MPLLGENAGYGRLGFTAQNPAQGSYEKVACETKQHLT